MCLEMHAARRFRTIVLRPTGVLSNFFRRLFCIAGYDAILYDLYNLSGFSLCLIRRIRRNAPIAQAAGPPLDFQHHLRLLEERGLLTRIDRVIDKDSELHPLVRWQFQGGLAEEQRRAFLFTNVVDGSGRRYDIPVAVGLLEF